MAVQDQKGQLADAGYTPQDVANTIKGFGGGLKVPTIIDVPVDGVQNSGVNDGETLLDITVAGAIAQAATIAVYFTGPAPQNIIHALQRMIHPGTGDPVPTVISISYGLGPDDDQSGFSSDEFDANWRTVQRRGEPFYHRARLIGRFRLRPWRGRRSAEASYPATEPMVIACGGTTVGNVTGSTFDEFAWNDVGAGGPGGSGGGISAKFPVPSYQNGAGVPKHISTNKAGAAFRTLRATPAKTADICKLPPDSKLSQWAGQVPSRRCMRVCSLGLIPTSGSPSDLSIRSCTVSANRRSATPLSPPGPENNSFNGVTGYPVETGWDACTGWGSVKGVTLQNGLKAANAGSKLPS